MVAVKVENIAAARPQVGLNSADIVFVEEVEGSLTRLVAVYHTTFPKRVGPVRSARNTDVGLLPLFGEPGLVYSGANRKVQAQHRQVADRAAAAVRPGRLAGRAPQRVRGSRRRSPTGRRRSAQRGSIGWTFAADDARWDEAARRTAPCRPGRR